MVHIKKKKTPQNKKVLGLIFSTANLQVHRRVLAVTTPLRSELSLSLGGFPPGGECDTGLERKVR